MTEAYDDRFIRFSHATESVLKAITRYKNDCLARYGLRGMHLMTMVCLSRSGADGLTPGELARLCGVDKAFVSRTTGELRRLGYLSVDGGRPFSLKNGDQVLISRSRYETKLVRLRSRSFCEILQRKMLLGGGDIHEE